MEYKMTDTAAIHAFIFSGKATFTIRSLTSGNHWTFNIKQKDNVWFVRYLVNDESIYLGFIAANGQFYATYSMKNSTPRTVIDCLFKYIAIGRLHQKFEFFHVGKCGRCGRPLTDPASIERGLGPHCAKM